MSHGFGQVLRFRFHSEELCRLVCQASAQYCGLLSLPNNSGSTPLHVAAAGNEVMAFELVTASVSVDQVVVGGCGWASAQYVTGVCSVG